MSYLSTISRYFVKTGQTSVRFKPINKWPKNQTVFNCMSFFIFCPKHKNIAVCDNIDSEKELTVRLPYIFLSPDYKKRMTAEDGICLLLSDGDSRLFAKYKEQKPFDTNISLVMDLHLIQAKCGFSRFICFARLHSDNPEFQCCRKTSRIFWSNPEYFPKDLPDVSIKIYCKDFESLMNEIRIFHGINNELLPAFISNYSINDEPEYVEQMILKLFNITEKQIELFFIDFIEHCFPEMAMNFPSFKAYLKKYGLFYSEKYLQRIFYGFVGGSEQFNLLALFEGELLIGLAYLDFECPSYKCRLRFVFRFYDFNRDGYLSREEFKEMIRDIDTNQSQEEIERVVSDNILLNDSEIGMTFEEFYFQVREGWLEGTDRLCRFDLQILRKILSYLENREKSGFKKRLNQYFIRLFND